MPYTYLNPEKALIWRIVHRDNVNWILEHGLHCGNSPHRAHQWVSIGNEELITKRATHPVRIAPGGVLNDYVPFYFTPFSVMMMNIKTGYGGVKRRSNDEIVILVSSLHRVRELGLPFVFTDSHAYYAWANFYDDLARLDRVDWQLLQNRDFKRDPDDLKKFERYQAEALIHGQCPLEALVGIACYSEEVKTAITAAAAARGVELPVHVKPSLYF